MPGALHIATLRGAALLVPAPQRTEWLAEWIAELSYVDRGATNFCFGSFRDAFFLRISSFSIRDAFSLESPSGCILFLAGLAAAILTAATLSRKLWLVGVSGPLSPGQFALGLLWVYALSLLVLLTLNPLALGEYPANRFAPPLTVRLRRWLFLAAKIGLLVPIIWFATVVPVALFPPAVWLLFFGWIFGLRWALADQRKRCPVCLCPLSGPVEVGIYAHVFLDPRGTQLICARGHGSLHIPAAQTTWRSRQTWHYRGPGETSHIPPSLRPFGPEIARP
jgi:hypothetical protein